MTSKKKLWTTKRVDGKWSIGPAENFEPQIIVTIPDETQARDVAVLIVYTLNSTQA